MDGKRLQAFLLKPAAQACPAYLAADFVERQAEIHWAVVGAGVGIGRLGPGVEETALRFTLEYLAGFDRSETGEGLMQVFFLRAHPRDQSREGQPGRSGIKKVGERSESQHVRAKEFGAEPARRKCFSPLIKEGMFFGGELDDLGRYEGPALNLAVLKPFV